MRTLVAGIGNKYMGDDGFGPKVVETLLERGLPEGVEARDVGLCGITLAPDLEDYEMVIFIDAFKLGDEPGTIYCEKIERGMNPDISLINIHDAGMKELILFADKIGTLPPNVFVIGCEINEIKLGEGLSPEIDGSIDAAVDLTLELLQRQGKRK